MRVYTQICLLLLNVLLTVPMFIQLYEVHNISMEPTLHSGQWVQVNTGAYRQLLPKRGDIIIFHATSQTDYIKRVIGLPGEVVKARGDQVFINDRPIREPYLPRQLTLYYNKGVPRTKDFGPVKIPGNAVFVMGDNRRHSLDSRMIGPVPLNRIVGRVEM